jgi:Excalibur calcium-binding domain
VSHQVFAVRAVTLDGRRAQRGVIVLIVWVAIGFSAGTAHAAIPHPFQNCGQLNARYPHGVGKVGARDKTTGKPVTNFKRNTYVYLRAMYFNKRLDSDHDAIACERH